MSAVVHVTHEATVKVGGIGAVLAGLLTSKTYLNAFDRNILVGTLWPGEHHGEERLGPDGEVLYSSLDSLYRSPLAAVFQRIEQEYGVGIVYGRRHFVDKDTGVSSNPEILLIDVSHVAQAPLGIFKFDLWKKFGLDSARYDHIYDYEQWVRLARPTIACLKALDIGTNPQEPAVILAHEYMGMPTALAGTLDPQGAFRTIFYAHEIATMRRIVEHRPGHDTMFYNVLRRAMIDGHFVDDVFGSQDDYYKHAVIKTVRFCDGVFCVGDDVLRELRFMGPDFLHVDAQLAYNGVPCWKIDAESKFRSRSKLQQYAKNLLGYKPDFVFSHVTRLVASKGMWRDLRVLEHLEPLMRDRNESAVLFVLSTEVPARRPDDIRSMEQHYNWPVVHREGLPDLSHGEAIYYQGVQEFNAKSRNIKVVFINQFGFEQRVCGLQMPTDMDFMDIRKGSDVEFGQSIYEPFGIAQVEPISFGGICIFSSVCGCEGFVRSVKGHKPTPNVIVADYTKLPDPTLRADQLIHIGQYERDQIEHTVAEQVARDLIDRLPRELHGFDPLIERGYELAQKMSWDAVATNYVVPGILRASKAHRVKQIA